MDLPGSSAGTATTEKLREVLMGVYTTTIEWAACLRAMRWGGTTMHPTTQLKAAEGGVAQLLVLDKVELHNEVVRLKPVEATETWIVVSIDVKKKMLFFFLFSFSSMCWCYFWRV